MKRILSCLFFLLFMSLLSACNQGESQPPEAQAVPKQVQVSWSMSTAAVAPGDTFSLLWQFEMAPGWHLYWKGRNDSGFPPAVTLNLPEGWQAGPLLWPAPERYESAGGILDHVYHERLQLVQEVRVGPEVGPGGEVEFSARVDWLACKDECVPGHEMLELKIPAGKLASADQVSAALNLLPQPAPAGGVAFLWDAATVRLTVEDAIALEFYPFTDCLKLKDLLADGTVQGNTITLGLRSVENTAGSLKGILHQVLNDGSTRNWIIDAQYGG